MSRANVATTEQEAHATTTSLGRAATTGYKANATTAGHGAAAVTAGDGAHATTAGQWAHAATAGDWSDAITAGHRAVATTAGQWAHAVTAGDGANATTAGHGAAAITAGDGAHAMAAGWGSQAVTTGDGAHAMSANGSARARRGLSIGRWVRLTDEDGGRVGVVLPDDHLRWQPHVVSLGDGWPANTWITIREGVVVTRPDVLLPGDGRGWTVYVSPDGDLYMAGCRGPWTYEQCVAHWSRPGHPWPRSAKLILDAITEHHERGLHDGPRVD